MSATADQRSKLEVHYDIAFEVAREIVDLDEPFWKSVGALMFACINHAEKKNDVFLMKSAAVVGEEYLAWKTREEIEKF